MLACGEGRFFWGKFWYPKPLFMTSRRLMHAENAPIRRLCQVGTGENEEEKIEYEAGEATEEEECLVSHRSAELK